MFRGFLSACAARSIVVVLALGVPLGLGVAILAPAPVATAASVVDLRHGRVGESYSQPILLLADGPTTLVSGAIPPGLTLNIHDIRGYPTTAGTFLFQLEWTQNGSPGRTDFSLTVDKGPQMIDFLSTPPASPVVGGQYQVSASSLSQFGSPSGLPVTFAVDPASSAGACTINGSGLVRFTGVGTCIIDANQAGNANYLAAPQKAQSLTIGKASQAITFTSTPPVSAVFGGTYQVTATGGGSGQPVTFAVDPASTTGACTINGSGLVTFTGLGTCIIDANQAGNANYTAAPQVSQTITIGKASQTIRFITSPPARPQIDTLYLPAAVGGGSGNPVTFSGTGSCNVATDGSTIFLGAGTCVIAADQAGDANYSAAPTVTQTVTVVRASQAIRFTSTPPANPVVGGVYQVTATGGGSGQPVTFAVDPASTAGVCTINGTGLVRFTGVGTCIIDADQAGDADYTAASQKAQSLTIGKASQAITFTSTPPVSAVFGGTYQVTATGGGSGQPVTFAVDPASTAGVCTINGSGLVRFTGVGTCIIDADQAGNADYTAAAQVNQTVSVSPAAQTPTPGPTGVLPEVGAAGASAGLPFTGTNALPVLAVGAALLLAGLLLLVVTGQRRDGGRHH